jgi:hypothetical protein
MESIKTAKELETYLEGFSRNAEVRKRLTQNASYHDVEGSGDLLGLFIREGKIGETRAVYHVSLRNWRLNLGDLLEGLASATGAAGSALVKDPVGTIVGVISALRALGVASSREFAEREAKVVIAIWKDRADDNVGSVFGRSGLSREDFDQALETLEDLKIIEVKGERIRRKDIVLFGSVR